MVTLTDEEIIIGLKKIGINSPSMLETYLKEYEKDYISQFSDSASQKNLSNSNEKEDTILL